MTCFGTAAPFGEQLWKHVGAGVELLNPVITHVDDVHTPISLIHGHSAREVELAVSVPETPPGHDELPVHIELLHTKVGAIDHIHIPTHPINRNPPG